MASPDAHSYYPFRSLEVYCSLVKLFDNLTLVSLLQWLAPFYKYRAQVAHTHLGRAKTSNKTLLRVYRKKSDILLWCISEYLSIVNKPCEAAVVEFAYHRVVK